MAFLSQEPAALEGDWSQEPVLAPRGLHAVTVRRRALPAWFWVGTIVAVSTLIRGLVGLKTSVPWIFPDELIYSDLAKSFAASGHFRVSGEPFSVWSYGPLYPIVIAPFYRLSANASQAYALVKGFQAFLMSTSAVPAYLIARRFLGRRLALLGAGITVLLPATIYASKLMTESLALPVFLWAFLAIYVAIERPTRTRTAVAIAMIVIAVLTRAQMVILLPAFLSARLILARLSDHPAKKRDRGFHLRASIVALVAVAVVAPILASSAIRQTVLGKKAGVIDQLRPLQAPKWFLYHLAELDLAVGIIPFAACLLLTVLVAKRRLKSPSRSLLAFVAVAASCIAWLLVLVAFYASNHQSTQLYERYLIYTEPLLILGFLAWLHLSFPRTKRTAAGAAVVAGALPALIPFHTFITGRLWSVNSATPGLVPWGLLSQAVGKGAQLTAIVLLMSGAAAWSFLRARPDRSHVLVLVAVAWLASGRMVVDVANNNVSHLVRADVFRNNADNWVDAAVGGQADVVGIWAGVGPSWQRTPTTLWQTTFWNDSVRRVYRLREQSRPELVEPKLETRAGLLLSNDRPLTAQYVVIDHSIPLAGALVKRMGDLALVRVDGVVRLRPPSR